GNAPTVSLVPALSTDPAALTFSLVFTDTDNDLVPGSALATQVQVQFPNLPPGAQALNASLVGTFAGGPDGDGAAASVTLTYHVAVPPGPANTLALLLAGAPVLDLAGNAAPGGPVGTLAIPPATPASLTPTYSGITWPGAVT